MKQRSNYIRLILFILLVIIILITLFEFRGQFNIQNLRALIAHYGMLAPLVFIAIYILATILFLPGSVLTIVGGLIFGAFWGTIYNLIGAVIGATSAFLIARYLASDWVERKAHDKVKLLLRGVANEGWRFVAVLRLVPLIPFNILNYAFGLTRIGIISYTVASGIFMLPGTIAYTYLGSLGDAFVHGNAREIVTKASIAVGLLVLVGSLPYFVKRFRNKKLPEPKNMDS